jgi:hypothetical protein
MGRSRAAFALLLVLTACKREPSGAVPEGSAPAQGAPATAASDKPAPSATATRSAESFEPEARTLLSAWEKAQNEGALPGYEALYAGRFTGVRRSGPRTRNFDRSGWLKDRSRMFASPMKVHFAQQSAVMAGDKLIVVGEQTFAQGSYEDRGQKRFVLAREGGAVRIEREEMLSSELGALPKTDARFVTGVDAGPQFVLLSAAEAGGTHGALLGAKSDGYFGVASYALGAADEARLKVTAKDFLEGPVQLVSAGGVCTTRGVGLRFVRVAYAYLGGSEGDPERKAPSTEEIARELSNVAPQGFWAVELEKRCVEAPLVAVPGDKPIAVYAHAELGDSEKAAQTKLFAAAPFAKKLPAEERETVFGALQHTRFTLGDMRYVFSQSAEGCSSPVVVGLFDGQGELVMGGDGGGLERVDAVADLDGDGVAELIGGAAIGVSPLVIRDAQGTEKLRTEIPFVLCPC